MVHPLIERGLLKEVEIDLCNGDPMWRETGDGHGVTLAITEAGLAVLGIEADSAPQAAHGGEEADETSDAAPVLESPQQPPQRLTCARSGMARNRRR